MQGQLSIFWIGGAGMSTAVASTLVGGGGGGVVRDLLHQKMLQFIAS